VPGYTLEMTGKEKGFQSPEKCRQRNISTTAGHRGFSVIAEVRIWCTGTVAC